MDITHIVTSSGVWLALSSFMLLSGSAATSFCARRAQTSLDLGALRCSYGTGRARGGKPGRVDCECGGRALSHLALEAEVHLTDTSLRLNSLFGIAIGSTAAF